MKSQDALDRVGGFKRLSRAERQAYAIQKQSEEEQATNRDQQKIKRLASKYEEIVKKQRREVGLE